MSLKPEPATNQGQFQGTVKTQSTSWTRYQSPVPTRPSASNHSGPLNCQDSDSSQDVCPSRKGAGQGPDAVGPSLGLAACAWHGPPGAHLQRPPSPPAGRGWWRTGNFLPIRQSSLLLPRLNVAAVQGRRSQAQWAKGRGRGGRGEGRQNLVWTRL